MSQVADRPGTYRATFAVREFRWYWYAQLGSVIGDQLARVALAVLVFDSTGSALWTALVYALTFVPWVLGGPLLSGVADRFRRRQVMISCDLIRAALAGLMAVPGMPLWLVGVLVLFLQLASAPFEAARAALLPDILRDDRYVVAGSVANMTHQFAQVAGFAAGGLAIAAVGPRTALAANAATFILSAFFLVTGVRNRPGHAGERSSPFSGARDGVRLILGDVRLRALLALALLPTFDIAAEALAIPYADELGGGATTAGLLMAAQPLGTVLGSFLITRVPPRRRLRLIGPLAMLDFAAIGLLLLGPGLILALSLLVISGLAMAYHVPTRAAFVTTVPEEKRGQAYGIALTALLTGQGLGIAVSGALADHIAPHVVIGALAVPGLVAAVAIHASWLRRALPGLEQ